MCWTKSSPVAFSFRAHLIYNGALLYHPNCRPRESQNIPKTGQTAAQGLYRGCKRAEFSGFYGRGYSPAGLGEISRNGRRLAGTLKAINEAITNQAVLKHIILHIYRDTHYTHDRHLTIPSADFPIAIPGIKEDHTSSFLSFPIASDGQ